MFGDCADCWYGTNDGNLNTHPVTIKDSQNTALYVLAVSNVLTAPIFSNSRNFEMEGDTLEKHGIKSLDP